MSMAIHNNAINVYRNRIKNNSVVAGPTLHPDSTYYLVRGMYVCMYFVHAAPQRDLLFGPRCPI